MKNWEKKQEILLRQQVESEIRKNMREVLLPFLAKKEKDYDLVLKSRRGVFTADEYKVLLRCLHPDNLMSLTPEQRTQGFQIFNAKKVVLLSEKDLPTEPSDLPRTLEELDKRRTKRVKT